MIYIASKIFSNIYYTFLITRFWIPDLKKKIESLDMKKLEKAFLTLKNLSINVKMLYFFEVFTDVGWRISTDIKDPQYQKSYFLKKTLQTN